jgi:disease resistance protein RPS2
LTDLVTSIRPIATQIRQYRLELNRKRGTSIAQTDDNASQWVIKLHDLLRQALPMVEKCTIPRFDVFSRYQMSRKISGLISEIKKHLELVPLVLLEQQTQMHMEMRRESAQASSSTSASTSQAPTGRFFIEEALIVGQEQAFATLEKLVIDAEVQFFFRAGVVGKGGSGKTLLLKRVFNSQKVRDLFRDGLLLWLTVSQFPSFSSLRNELCKQIGVQTKEDHDQNMNEEDVKSWLSQRMQDKRFALFFDDVWGEGGKLLEELGLSKLTDHPNSKIIVSSRSRRALFEMGVADKSTLTMGDLSEEQSWELFAHQAFPYNNGNPPANIDERRAKLVCDKCGGLPLAIKVIGRTMAGITDAQEWELAILRLPNANSEDHQALHDRLRWSYDALGNYDVNLQLCFLYLAAFTEDQIIDVESDLIPLWIGEGLLERNERGHDPFEMGRIHANLLADRCLIEPLFKEVDGRVVSCRMHDMLRGLAIQIAEQEENFYCCAGIDLSALVENEYSGCTRLFLNFNQLSSLPKSLRAPKIRSLLMAANHFTKIPGKVIASMISLKVLDLSNTSVESLPNSLGCLKQLVYLKLRSVPIKRLPEALTNLSTLQILDLSSSGITQLPSSIHKLRSLCYLDLSYCDDLQCLPLSISRLTSLQHLDIFGCRNVWTKHDKAKPASINDLGCLTQLKRLRLDNEAETISEGTLGSMVQMDTLELFDRTMTSLPTDMMNMSKLKRLRLCCPQILKFDSRFCEFQNLVHLHLWYCERLEELSDLHKLKGLRQLYIYGCSKLKKLPTEFGEKGAFPLLELFSLIELEELEELPTIIANEDVLSSLKIFTIMKCEALKMLPEDYLHLKALKKIKVYGCSMVLENLQKKC